MGGGQRNPSTSGQGTEGKMALETEKAEYEYRCAEYEYEYKVDRSSLDYRGKPSLNYRVCSQKPFNYEKR
jgi:hypothetical protein